uniref:Autophagy related 2A n=1 Tax=Salmo trutta TaxID=8032 RepID=A0A673VPN3_SALTR
MSRWLFPWSGSIKKRACRYLLQHYLGHFLQERLSLEQLSLDLYNGSGVIKEINIDVWAVNELLESLGAPFEIVDGFVSSIEVTIPWSALVTDHCTLVISGLQITCRPKYRSGGLDSQGWSTCMTSSMQLAQECLKDPPEASEEPPAPLEGLEMFAQTIETVLRRIKVTLLDTIVRIEHHPLDMETGIALEVHIKRLEYCDEAVRDPNQTVPVDIHQPPAFLHKILQLSSVQLLYETTGGPQEEEGGQEEEEDDPPAAQQPLLIGSCSGFMETTVKIKQNDMLPGPKVCVFQWICSVPSCVHLKPKPSGAGVHSRPLDSEDLRLIEEDLSKQLSSSPGDRDPDWDEEPDMEPYLTGLENGDMFFSMGPGMTSSVTSARSLSDSMASSTHSQASYAQGLPQGPPQGPRRYPVPGSLSSLPQYSKIPGRSSQSEPLKPEVLLRLSLGGLTLTLLEQDPPPGLDTASSLAQVSQVFFRELAFFKDSMFSERDFHHLRASFAKACPHSHLRMTGAAVQVACEMRSAGRHSRAVTSDLSFSRLELLECLWKPGKPQYTEVGKGKISGLLYVFDCLVIFEHSPLPSVSQTQSSELHSSLSLLSPHAILKLRFPIPDLRPYPLRRPPSQRAVRQENLVLELCDLDIRSQEAIVCSLSLSGTYEGWEGGSFPCIRVKKSQDSMASGGEALGSGLGGLGVGLMRDLGSMSFENPCELREKTSSPFSSNRTMFETEEMVIPADPEEMQHFQSQCVSQCVVDVSLPLAYIFLPSKQAFQSVYNRSVSLSFSLILKWLAKWYVLSNSLVSTPVDHLKYVVAQFYNCDVSGLSDSDSEEEDAQFYTASVSARCGPSEPRPNHDLSLLSLTVVIGKGRLQAMTDSKGETGSQEDGCHGELMLDLEGGKMFSVVQHQNNPHLSFLCLESRRVELYHKAVVKDSPVPRRLEMPSFTPPGHLDPTIYPTEVGVSSVSGRETEVHMLSTAFKITLDPQRNVKEFLVALRLHGATMRHQMAQTNHSWHEQLVDFLDVIDDPILGYTSPAVITVLHTHLATCAVDYRPLYLPLRVLFTAESFSLSSNIIVDTATFHLRFILDDSALYLSDKCESDVVDLRRDYVCVLDIDLLELAITTWKGSDTGKLSQPLFELRCSNNVVHLHTCADSCAALVNMLQYLVSQGDLHPPPLHTSPTEIAGQKLPLSESPASLPPCPPAETAEINQCDLLDALIDTERSHPDEDMDSVPRGSPVSVYLFPGEAPKLPTPVVIDGEGSELDGLVATATEVQADMMSEEGSEGSEDNEDFCILEAPGMGIPPRDGEPLVTVLTEGPIRVREGHFSRPRGSSDLLRAPSHFPVPQSRVVLREVSVVWHLYGGRDFGGKPRSAQGCEGRSAPCGMRGSPSRSAAPSRPQNSWRWAGGGGRQHNLLMEIQLTKVSFQHESYLVVVSAAGPCQEGGVPGVGVGAVGEQPLSRQVFIVQELEIRDRLASSQLNKFLYLYTSESMPRRAHSNMVREEAFYSHLSLFTFCCESQFLTMILIYSGIISFFKQKFASYSSKSQNTSSQLPTALSSSSAGSTSSTDQPIYFREFRFTSEVPIWLDYQGKHVVIEQGTFAGILIGLAQLNCSELKLKRLCCRHGLLGVDKVIQYAVTEWLTDIRKNQLPGILGGVGPMHSVVQLFHGVRDLFWMPIEQYRRDGRIIRGLQRGAASFGTSTASAALELSNRLVQAIQATAETVYDILSPTPPLNRYITEGRPPSNQPRRAHQPADLREGVAKAYDTVREGMMDTAQTLCDVASRGHEQKGLPGAVGGVLRQIPPTVVRPLIVASEATSNLLGGMRNQIKPDARKEDFLKWRSDEGQE